MKSSLELRVAVTQEFQLICACCRQPYDPTKFRDDVLFGAEKYAVCPLCTYVVPPSVFDDDNYRNRCCRVYARRQQESTERAAPPEAASPKLRLRELLDKMSERSRRNKTSGLRFKIAKKGGVSVYGLARFPLTLYYNQWVRLLEEEREIREFLESHKSRLKLLKDG